MASLGSPTVHEISTQLFPTLEGFGVMLGASEVAGHLDLLKEAGQVAVSDSVPHRYTAT